jgi:hypothetical protein
MGQSELAKADRVIFAAEQDGTRSGLAIEWVFEGARPERDPSGGLGTVSWDAEKKGAQ